MSTLRRVWSKTSEKWIQCNWFECDKDGYENHKAVFHDHPDQILCNDPRATHINYVFCSKRHMMYYVNSNLDLWNLPSGMKNIS